MSKPLADQARSISKKLSEVAKKLDVAYQDVATEFLIERMVARLVQEKWLADRLVFKGGYVALRAYQSPRFTVDLDAVLRNGDAQDISKRSVAAIETDINDAVWFRWDKEIDLKTQGEYGGKRLVFRAGIGVPLKDLRLAQMINMDIGIGDPITPGPIQQSLFELLGGGSISWNIYPIETAAAEKLHTLVVRGSDNSRSKDIFDLFLFLPKCDGPTLLNALAKTFKHRGDILPASIGKELKKIDLALIKRGWNSAIQDIEGAPTLEEAFSKVVEEIQRLK